MRPKRIVILRWPLACRRYRNGTLLLKSAARVSEGNGESLIKVDAQVLSVTATALCWKLQARVLEYQQQRIACYGQLFEM